MSAMETSLLLAIGTRKGLWLAHSDDRENWATDAERDAGTFFKDSSTA